MTTPSAIQYFEAIADDYIRADGKLSRQMGDQYAKFLINIKIPDGKMLDVGIGTGTLTQVFRKREREIYGVDGSEEMLKICAANGFKRANLQQVDLESQTIPFKDDTFSFTITNSTLCYIHNAVKVIAEMIRVTKPNGIIIIDPHVHIHDFNEIVGYVTAKGNPAYFAQNDLLLKKTTEEKGTKIIAEHSRHGPDFKHPKHGEINTENVVYILRKNPAPA